MPEEHNSKNTVHSKISLSKIIAFLKYAFKDVNFTEISFSRNQFIVKTTI
jgi:hypothetical protein